MKCSIEFPVSIGQTLYMLNFETHTVEQVVVTILWINATGAINIGLEQNGEPIRGRCGQDLGKTLFETEEEAVCAFLAM